MKRKIILFGCLITLIYGFKPTNFGLESISFNLNHESIATWTLLQTKIDTIVLNNFGVKDTIQLVSWCDHGCFEGAKISIEKNNKKIITIKSNTEFQNHLDSLKNNLLLKKEKARPIQLKNILSFIPNYALTFNNFHNY